MSTNVYLQARLSSTRLPSKVLKKLGNKTILEIIVERTKRIKNVDNVILVTGDKSKNKSIVDVAKKLELKYFCGNEINVLDRFHEASKLFPSDKIIRITCDNPLIDPKLINQGLEIFLKNNLDILSNDRIPTFPYGLNFEIFRKSALNKSWKENKSKFSNEADFYSQSLSPVIYMLNNDNFINYDFIHPENSSDIRLTIDYPEDFELVSKVFAYFEKNKQDFDLNDILTLFRKKPGLKSINKNHLSSNYVSFTTNKK